MFAASNGGLLVPQDITDLLTVSVDSDADNSTIRGMTIINGAANDWTTGLIDDNYYFDLLAEFGIDPYLFVEEVEEHVRLLML